MPEAFDFAVSGINHNHIYGQVDALLGAGCRLDGVPRARGRPRRRVRPRLPRGPARLRRARDPRRSQVLMVVGAGIPGDRAGMALRAMRAGKDVMVDKPGCTTETQLADLRRTQADTGRIWSVCYSEHYLQKSTVAASRLVAEGAIGRVVNTIGLGPHRIGLHARPDWFWDTAPRRATSSSTSPRTSSSSSSTSPARPRPHPLVSVEANFAHPDRPGWNDYGHAIVASDHATGFVRVDWMTAAGSPAWGDGRLFLMGTEGNIELRKYMDIEGRPGGDHLFLTDGKGTRYMDCSDTAARLRRAPARRRPPPHRDRHAAGRTASSPWSSPSTAHRLAKPLGPERRNEPGSRSGSSAAASAPRHIEAYQALPDDVRGRRPLRHRRRPRRRGGGAVRHPGGGRPARAAPRKRPRHHRHLHPLRPAPGPGRRRARGRQARRHREAGGQEPRRGRRHRRRRGGVSGDAPARSSSTASATACRSSPTCAPRASPPPPRWRPPRPTGTAVPHTTARPPGAAPSTASSAAASRRTRSTSTTSSARCSAPSPRCTPAPRAG